MVGGSAPPRPLILIVLIFLISDCGDERLGRLLSSTWIDHGLAGAGAPIGGSRCKPLTRADRGATGASPRAR